MNLFGTNIGLNKYAEKLRHIELFNIYHNKKLNGLITVGVILALLSSLHTLFFEKEEKA
ncbi:hypothetical protein [Staphylococcus edaphicus]|uniref:Uncharacterized protein n=1 Tax=Staphylococcus edaphicus TaxID=1955013 RepID=A0ABY4QBZ5_9STAP|nr:hypothetical protein [Staphylococcus edaphicus]UQW81451.1 hypothetical protein MNY58_12980 [Staphylococcus edaphicus]